MRAARLGGLWFGIQAVWGAILGLVVQDRVAALAAHPVAAFGALAGAGAAIAAVTQLLSGFASDRYRARHGDRRPFYAAGVALAVPALVAIPIAPSVAVLAAALLGLQLAMNVAGGPYQAIVADYLDPDAVGRGSSWMSVTQFSGSFVGPLLATVLHGAPLGFALALCLVGGWAVTDRTCSQIDLRPRAILSSSKDDERLRLDRDARTVIASRAFINLGFYTLVGFLFFFVRSSLHVADPRLSTGILILTFTISGVAGAAFAGPAADRRDKRVVVTVACVAVAIAVGAFAAAGSFAVAVGCAIGSGIAWGAFFTADWAIAYRVLPAGALGSAMGVWNLAATIPQVVAPLLTAPLVAALDARSAGLGPRAAFVLVVVEFAAGTAWLWRLRRV